MIVMRMNGKVCIARWYFDVSDHVVENSENENIRVVVSVPVLICGGMCGRQRSSSKGMWRFREGFPLGS
jgi:hypothetical protein